MDGICETCQLPPDRAVQAGHPYTPILNRVPGVHPTVDDGRARSSQPGHDIEAPGEIQMELFEQAEAIPRGHRARYGDPAAPALLR